MIKTLVEIGKALREYYPMPIVEIPYTFDDSSPVTERQKKKYPKVIVVNLISNSDNVLKLTTIELEDYNSQFALSKYFFRNPPAAHGPAPSLSFKLPGKKNSLAQRLGIIEILGFKKSLSNEELAERILNFVEKQKENGSISKSQPILVVIKIDNKWPAEIKKLTDSFKKNFLESLADYKRKPLWKVKGKCHICGKEGIVYGGLNKILKFYTVDKYGYAPELNPKIAWKQCALCEECVFDLERGRRAVDEFLTFSFYGKEFWLLPSLSTNLEGVLQHFKDFRGKVYKASFVENLEDRILYEASKQKVALFYHFIFVQKEQQALRIRLHIEEILPSLLAQYIETKHKVEKEFNDFLADSSIPTGNFQFNFFSQKELKETRDKPGFSDEDFYTLVEKVFRKSPIDERWLLSKIMARISKDMANNESLPWWTVLEAFLSLEFLLKWGILKRKIEGGLDMQQIPYQEFFEQYKDFFNHPAKRALVLLGVLIQKFLNYQYGERGSTPFIKMLKNLRLDQSDIKSIYVALLNKMNEYGVGHYWSDLKSVISLNLLTAGEKWGLSSTEIGFYIAIGMSLHSLPIFSKKGNQEEVMES